MPKSNLLSSTVIYASTHEVNYLLWMLNRIFRPTKFRSILGGLGGAHFLRENSERAMTGITRSRWREPIPTDVLRALQH